MRPFPIGVELRPVEFWHILGAIALIYFLALFYNGSGAFLHFRAEQPSEKITVDVFPPTNAPDVKTRLLPQSLAQFCRRRALMKLQHMFDDGVHLF